jgi:hypothetical protein
VSRVETMRFQTVDDGGRSGYGPGAFHKRYGSNWIHNWIHNLYTLPTKSMGVSCPPLK